MKKQLGLALAAGLATSAVLVGSGGSASATGVSNVTFGISNNSVGATDVTYTWQFSADATQATGPITLTVPTGTATPADWAPNLQIFGLSGACTPSITSPAAGASGVNSISLDIDTCGLAAGVPVEVSINDLTNTSTAANMASFKSTVSVGTGTPVTGDSNVVSAGGGTYVTVVVPNSLTLTNDTTSLELDPIAGAGAVSADAVNLTVMDNAGGYDLSACMGDLKGVTDPANDQIDQANLTTPTTLNTSNFGFGASASLDTSTTSGDTSNAALTTAWSGTSATPDPTVLGYQSDCAVASGAAKIATNAGATDGDVIHLTNAVSVAGGQAPDTYKGVITYVVAPAS